MLNHAHTSRSRHGIFYFRWPISPVLHPQQRRTDVKLSLGTRCPRIALTLARWLIGTAVCGIAGAGRHMRYDEYREHVRAHFQNALTAFKGRVALDGPPTAQALEAMHNSLSLDRADILAAMASGYPDGEEGIVRALLNDRGVPEVVPPEQRDMMLREYHIGFQAYFREALAHLKTFADFDLAEPRGDTSTDHPTAPSEPATPDPAAFSEAAQSYLDEGRRSNQWVPKTLASKVEDLKLLGELTGQIPLAAITKADARAVKDKLLRLPKNRNKMPRTRNMPLADALKLTDVEVISTQTVNGYISNYKTFFEWAVNNGYAKDNLFDGMSVRSSRRSSVERKAFSASQLALLFRHVTDPASAIVKKDCHRWATLISMFTGCRVNEAAQLHLSDIRQERGIWCIDFNEKDGKSLKSEAGVRVVPVHDRLMAAGFINFVATRRASKSERLFPEYPYSMQNGYGRNLSRWFNETLIPELGLEGQGLVFHSMRHSMVTLLSQADVPEPIVKAIVGHEQKGVTQQHYFKAGYTLEQLQANIGLFTF